LVSDKGWSPVFFQRVNIEFTPEFFLEHWFDFGFCLSGKQKGQVNLKGHIADMLQQVKLIWYVRSIKKFGMVP
jgi:hypothetical protein